MASRRWLTRGLPAAAAAGGLLALALTIRPHLAGWDTPPAAKRIAAQEAVAAAVTTDARRLARPELEAAQAALEAAHRHEARQAARMVPWSRDYRAAEAAFDAARVAASTATDVAVRRARLARDETRGLVTVADTLVAGIERMARDMPFSRAARTDLRAARTAVDEARALMARDRLDEAVAAAQRALDRAERARDRALPAVARFADAAQVDAWRRWIDETVAWSAGSGRTAVIVYKEKSMLVLYDDGRPVASYAADMGSNRLQQKRHAGDKATPEGRYRIVAKKQGGQTRYHKALLLDYPNAEDRARFARAQREGRVPADVGPGRNIEIHGDGGRDSDWTLGCVALANADIDALFARVGEGTPVTIVGGDGRDGVFSTLWRSHATPEAGR